MGNWSCDASTKRAKVRCQDNGGVIIKADKLAVRALDMLLCADNQGAVDLARLDLCRAIADALDRNSNYPANRGYLFLAEHTNALNKLCACIVCYHKSGLGEYHCFVGERF